MNNEDTRPHGMDLTYNIEGEHRDTASGKPHDLLAELRNALEIAGEMARYLHGGNRDVDRLRERLDAAMRGATTQKVDISGASTAMQAGGGQHLPDVAPQHQERRALAYAHLAEILLARYTALFPNYAWTDEETAIDLMAAEITALRHEAQQRLSEYRKTCEELGKIETDYENMNRSWAAALKEIHRLRALCQAASDML